MFIPSLSFRNVIKDINYYRVMVRNDKGSKIVIDSISEAIDSTLGLGHQDAYLPELIKLF